MEASGMCLVWKTGIIYYVSMLLLELNTVSFDMKCINSILTLMQTFGHCTCDRKFHQNENITISVNLQKVFIYTSSP